MLPAAVQQSNPAPAAATRGRWQGPPPAPRSAPTGTYLHVAVDDYSLITLVEACDDETAAYPGRVPTEGPPGPSSQHPERADAYTGPPVRHRSLQIRS